MKMKKEARKRLKREQNTMERSQLKARIILIMMHITQKMKLARGERIQKITKQIRERVDNGGKIWELKRKLVR